MTWWRRSTIENGISSTPDCILANYQIKDERLTRNIRFNVVYVENGHSEL